MADPHQELEEITRELAASSVKVATLTAQAAVLEEELATVRANRVRMEKDVKEKQAAIEVKTTELVRLHAELQSKRDLLGRKH